MKKNVLKMAIKPITLIAILGLALTVLAGCGIGHGPYRYGYNGYHGAGRGDDYRNSGFYSAIDGADGRGGYCGW
ncbi:MAG: hypothetical protein AB7S77_24580 [Desulfatirhabdiaceae bacterium]